LKKTVLELRSMPSYVASRGIVCQPSCTEAHAVANAWHIASCMRNHSQYPGTRCLYSYNCFLWSQSSLAGRLYVRVPAFRGSDAEVLNDTDLECYAVSYLDYEYWTVWLPRSLFQCMLLPQPCQALMPVVWEEHEHNEV